MGALEARVIILKLAPYADFAVFTPSGRRFQETLRRKANEDGTDSLVEVPGPGSFNVLWSCWRVYETAVFMLRRPPAAGQEDGDMVMTQAAMDYCFDAFRQLCRDFPECWFLCQRVEDRRRAEHMPRLMGRIHRKASQGTVVERHPDPRR